MTAVLERTPLMASLADWLAAAVTRPVGRRQPPQGRPFPYVVLYAIPGGWFSGPGLTGPAADAAVVVQANAVALRDDEADALLDAVRAAFLDRVPATGAFTQPAPVVAGWKIIDREPDGGPGDVSYSGAPPKRVFTASERYVLHVTPG